MAEFELFFMLSMVFLELNDIYFLGFLLHLPRLLERAAILLSFFVVFFLTGKCKISILFL